MREKKLYISYGEVSSSTSLETPEKLSFSCLNKTTSMCVQATLEQMINIFPEVKVQYLSKLSKQPKRLVVTAFKAVP